MPTPAHGYAAKWDLRSHRPSGGLSAHCSILFLHKTYPVSSRQQPGLFCSSLS